MTPRRTRRTALIVAACAGPAALAVLVWQPGSVWLALYLSLLCVFLYALAVAALAVTRGHVEQAFRLGALAAGRRHLQLAEPMRQRSSRRWWLLVAVVALAGIAAPVAAKAPHHPKIAPRQCYRTIEGQAYVSTCQPLKEDTPAGAKPASCWRWVSLPGGGETLVRASCLQLRDQQ